MSTTTINTLHGKKQNGEKFAVITGYDACFARLIAKVGIDVILVGDSLGNVLQGHDSTLPVSVDDMAYHIGAVRRGAAGPLIIGDMPFGSYNTPAQALDNAARLMAAGAHMVKLEGGAWLQDTVADLVARGMPVCAHLGLMPQSVNVYGGYKVQGREEAAAQRMLDDASLLQAAGASLLVVECVPRSLGQRLTQALDIPVIGIGAGPDTDAQVLVLHDMLGLFEKSPRFVRNFMAGADSVEAALGAYKAAVENGEFPAAEHCFD